MVVHVSFRGATADDVAAVREVARDCWERDYPGVVSREAIREGVAEWYDADRLRRSLTDDDEFVVLAEDDAGDVCAFAHAAVDGDIGTVLRLYVHPEYRGEGVGSDLLAETVDRLREASATRLRAMVLAGNGPGNEFYRAAGFESKGDSETIIAGEPYDERVYERALDSR
jgi:ribosomal protein S18 acetylase RimI-like enzyme